MSIVRILEILLYELIDLFPNLMLAILLFKGHLRFTKTQTAFFIVILYSLNIFSRIAALSNLSSAAFLSGLWIILYLAFYLICIRAELTKLLFVLLTIINYCSFVVIIFSYIAFHKFQKISATPYSFYSAILLLCVYLISYPIIFILLSKKLRPLLEMPSISKHWRYLWLVPGTFCLSYYYNLFSSGGIITYSSSISNVLFAVFYNAGALFVTYLMLKLIEDSNTAYILKEENTQLNMQFLQYENLKNRLEDARRAKHDLKQSMTVIQSYLRDNNMKGLQQFIGQYIETLPSDSPIVYCSNYALNALIVYYENLAREHAIAFHAEIEYPDSLCISSSDSTVLFGNLLENATEACMRSNVAHPSISFQIKVLHDMLIITLDNSYSGVIQKQGDSFLSSKSQRIGIGTSSIQRIAEKYHGIVKFDYDEHEFHVSVLLNIASQTT